MVLPPLLALQCASASSLQIRAGCETRPRVIKATASAMQTHATPGGSDVEFRGCSRLSEMPSRASDKAYAQMLKQLGYGAAEAVEMNRLPVLPER